MLKSEIKKEVYPPEETLVTSGATLCISGGNASIVFVCVEPPRNSPNMKVLNFPSKESSEIQPDSKDNEISSLKKKLNEAEKRIRELELENKKLRESSQQMSVKKSSELSILDTNTLDNLRRIKSLGRGSTSEVFEVAREERLALKVYLAELVNEDKENDNEEEEEKIVVNADNMRRFLLEYESINLLDHANIIKAFGICFGDSTHAPAILLEYCP